MLRIVVATALALTAGAAQAECLPGCEFASNEETGVCLLQSEIGIGVGQEPFICERPALNAGLVEVPCSFEDYPAASKLLGLVRDGEALYLISDKAAPVLLNRCS